MATEEINLGYWGKEMAWDEVLWWVMSSTPSPAVAALGWAHIYFLGIFYYFLELLEAHDFLKEAQFHSLKNYINLLCHGDTQRELVNTPGTHHVLHLFLVEWDPLSLGDLVHFYVIWLYWSMYCMLSSSQPLIKHLYLLILATHLKSDYDFGSLIWKVV